MGTIIPFPITGHPVNTNLEYRTIQYTMEQMAHPDQPWRYYDTMPTELLEYALRQGNALPSSSTWIPVQIDTAIYLDGDPAYRYSSFQQSFCPERTLPFTFCSQCTVQIIADSYRIDEGFTWRLPLKNDVCTMCRQPVR